jgi:cytochrome P450
MSDLPSHTNGIPRPRPLVPVLGFLVPLVRDILGTLDRWAVEIGDIYYVGVPGRPTWIVNRPDEIERVLVHSKQFVKGGELKAIKSLVGVGLVTSDGELWRKQRHMMQPAFHRERVAAYGQRMADLTERALHTWSPGEVRDVHKDSLALTLKIVSDVLFGDDEVPAAEVGDALEAVLRRFDGMMAVLPEWLPFGRFADYRRAIQRLDRVVYDVLARRRDQRGSDLLSTLLEAQDEDGAGMSDQQLRDELITLLIAGHETVANTLSWAWHLLSQHPDAERRLVDEVDALGEPPGARNLSRLPYTTAVLNEAMRLFPPAWMLTREVVDEWEIAGFRVGRGVQISVCPWVVQRDAKFFPEPLAFKPERWIDGSTDSIPDYAYFPFGGGQRMCIGRPFAMLEATIVLAGVARRFRLRPVPGHEVVPLPSMTLRPRDGLRMRVERR